MTRLVQLLRAGWALVVDFLIGDDPRPAFLVAVVLSVAGALLSVGAPAPVVAIGVALLLGAGFAATVIWDARGGPGSSA